MTFRDFIRLVSLPLMGALGMVVVILWPHGYHAFCSPAFETMVVDHAAP